MAREAEMQEGEDMVRDCIEEPGSHDAVRHILHIGSSVNWSSAPDDVRPGPLKINNNKGRSQAKPYEHGLLGMYVQGITDDLTGQPLPDALVTAGKKKELDYFDSKDV